MISPPIACLRITATAAWVTKNCPFTNTSYNKSQSFSVWSVIVLEIDNPALFTIISTPLKAKAATSIEALICDSLVTSKTAVVNASLPYNPRNSSPAAAKRSAFISFNITYAPSSTNFLAIAFPIPPALPVTKAIRPLKAFGLGIRCNLASSNNQYSILKASCRGNEVYSDIASAPFITLIALI